MTAEPRPKTGALVWLLRIVVAVGLAALMLWGGLQDSDPMASLIATDKMRHVIAFGAVGIFAGLFFTRTPGRLAMLALGLAFAVGFELLQPVFSSRVASLSDLVSSAIGIFAGYGFALALLSAVALVRR